MVYTASAESGRIITSQSETLCLTHLTSLPDLPAFPSVGARTGTGQGTGQGGQGGQGTGEDTQPFHRYRMGVGSARERVRILEGRESDVAVDFVEYCCRYDAVFDGTGEEVGGGLEG